MNDKTVNASSVAHFIGDMTNEANTPTFVEIKPTGALHFVRSLRTTEDGHLVLVIEPEPVK